MSTLGENLFTLLVCMHEELSVDFSHYMRWGEGFCVRFNMSTKIVYSRLESYVDNIIGEYQRGSPKDDP